MQSADHQNPATSGAREVLAFYLDAGADALIGEEPVDRMAEEAPPAARRTAKDIESVQLGPKSPPGMRTQSAAESAARPLRRLLRPRPRSWQRARRREAPKRSTNCARCSPISRAARYAPPRPSWFLPTALRRSRVMFVGEAPGYEEDISGRPFVGRSGKLLDLMMGAIGLDRTKAYIANVVPWRPPGNRTPTPQETAICLPFIRRQIELANPDILVCLGGPAMQTLLGTKDGITRSRGRWFPFDSGSREIRALATFHPAFLLRSPLQKRFAWRDFLALKKALG